MAALRGQLGALRRGERGPERRRRRWSEGEIAACAAAVNTGADDATIARALGRSEKAVRGQRQALARAARGDTPGTRPWTTTEHARCVALYRAGVEIEAIGQAMGRPVGGVQHQLASARARGTALGTRGGARWTGALDRRLMAAYAQGMTAAEIGRRLERSARSVTHRLYVLRRSGADDAASRRTAWTAAEDAALGALDPLDMSARRALARTLGRSASALAQRMGKLGLLAGHPRARARQAGPNARAQKPWRRDEEKALRERLAHGEDIAAIARDLGRTHLAAERHAQAMKITGVRRAARTKGLSARQRAILRHIAALGDGASCRFEGGTRGFRVETTRDGNIVVHTYRAPERTLEREGLIERVPGTDGERRYRASAKGTERVRRMRRERPRRGARRDADEGRRGLGERAGR